MPKVKVIHILPRLPHPVIKNLKTPEEYFTNIGNSEEFIKINEKPYWIGFFDGDHHVTAAKHLLQLTDKFDVECWRPYGNGIKKNYEKEVYGVKHKVFPAQKITIPHIGSLTWSNSMYRELLKEINENHLIINVSVGHVWSHILLFILLSKVKEKCIIVAKHRSGQFKKFSFNRLTHWKRLLKFYYLIEHHIELISLRKIDLYLTHSMIELNYLSSILGKDKVKYHRAGVDFEKLKPANASEKTQLRKLLNLPENKKILLAQGNFNSADYGYDILIDCYKKIKISGQNNDLLLVIIGGYKEEDLFNIGVKSGIIMVERVDQMTFYNYLKSCDFFTKAFFNETIIKFGGIGTSTIEALAFNIPVITNNLIHFPGLESELKEVGLFMRTPEELIENIVYMKDNLNKYSNCRKIAKEYYDLKLSNKVILDEYIRLSNYYYS